MTIIVIVLLVLWNALNTFLSVTAILGTYRNHKDVKAIESWYPFCEILKIKIPEKDDFEWERRKPNE